MTSERNQTCRNVPTSHGKPVLDTARGKWGVLGVTVMLVFAVPGAAACTRADAYTPPPATMVLQAAPSEIDPFDVYNGWMENPDAAQAKYGGQKVYCKIDVKRLGSTDIGPFIQLGPIKFLVAEPGDLKNVHIGSMVQVVGVIQGMDGLYLIISDCWVRVINPSVTAGY